MQNRISRGAKIVVEKWLLVKPKEKVLIVTSASHRKEAEAIARYVKKAKAEAEIMEFADQKGQVGHYFDEHEDAFDAFDGIVGATTHSLVTTRAVKRAKERGSRFLSLPLSTNDGRSLLEYDFLLMDTEKSKQMGDHLINKLNQCETIRVVTDAGTDLTFSKRGRDAQLFNGSTELSKGYASSSFEIFIPVLETETQGIGYVDASLGYLGIPEQTVKITLSNGKVQEIESNETGKKLAQYFEQFEDDGMYVAGELGIGLNTHAKCRGNCYIEDESAYGTFHIGFGRNLAFGGAQEAKAHFDLVFHKPDIYADGILIMEQGEIVSLQSERKQDETGNSNWLTLCLKEG